MGCAVQWQNSLTRLTPQVFDQVVQAVSNKADATKYPQAAQDGIDMPGINVEPVWITGIIPNLNFIAQFHIAVGCVDIPFSDPLSLFGLKPDDGIR